jgi:uncharacterized protein YceK
MNALKSAFTSYLSHLSGYIISGATIVSTLAPGTFPPKYAFVTAVATFVATAFSHGQAVQANAGSIVAAVADAATAAVTNAAKVAPVLLAVLMLPLFLTLHGCASVQSFLGSPTGEAVTIAGVKVAVTTAESKGITAAQINRVAKAVIADVSNSTVTVATLSSALNGELLKLGIPSGDVEAFQGLELAFDAYVIAKYGNNATVGNLQADITLFCTQAVIDTGG